ncbi:unnamed protein product [Symbiodinium sp. CCMP2592]|nr:unnamed protein product [Symbiodinium sp. CCMP2592]
MDAWLAERVLEAQRLAGTTDLEEKLRLRFALNAKIAIADQKVRDGRPMSASVETLSVDAWEDCLCSLASRVPAFFCPFLPCQFCEDILDKHRPQAAAAGLGIRPRWLESPQQQLVLDDEDLPDQPEEVPPVDTPYTPSVALFLTVRGPREGVLQAHQAARSTYVCTAASHSLTQRRDNLTAQMSSAWAIDVDTHIVRAPNYRGRLKTLGHDVDLASWEAFLKHEMSGQKFKSIGLLVDASPKAGMDVWVPIISIGQKAMAWTLQRLSDLLPSTADHETKLRESQAVADTLAAKMLSSDDKAATMSKLHLGRTPKDNAACAILFCLARFCRPKTIGKLRQQKLAAREHLKAVLHVVSLLDLQLQPPSPLLRPVKHEQHERRDYYDGRAYITDQTTGAAVWNDIPVEQAPGLVRIVLCPDEGSPLYSGFQFLAQRGLPLALLRDELPLGIRKTCSSFQVLCGFWEFLRLALCPQKSLVCTCCSLT